jgi:hypothetical protein
MPRLELYHFRYRNPLTGKWVRARYVAARHVIAERFAEFEIIGPPEIREWDQGERYFSQHVNVMMPVRHLLREAPQVRVNERSGTAIRGDRRADE